MKIPLLVTIVALVVVGYLFVKSAASVIRFSANVLTWVLILAVVIGAAWMLQNPKSNDSQSLWESKKKDDRWR